VCAYQKKVFTEHVFTSSLVIEIRDLEVNLEQLAYLLTALVTSFTSSGR
jgi:hypothetical protein